jgi:hypothetical protein
MKRKFLRFVAGGMAVCMFALMSMGFVVKEGHNEGFAEVVVCCEVDDTTAQQIINALNAETTTYQGIAPASILCIFGHSMARTTATVIDHRFWAATPRCRETIFWVDYCTRNNCNHMVMTQRSQTRIHCCK